MLTSALSWLARARPADDARAGGSHAARRCRRRDPRRAARPLGDRRRAPRDDGVAAGRCRLHRLLDATPRQSRSARRFEPSGAAGRLCRAAERLVDDGRCSAAPTRSIRSPRARCCGRAPPPTPSTSTAWRSTTKAASCSTATPAARSADTLSVAMLRRTADGRGACRRAAAGEGRIDEHVAWRAGAIALLAVALQPSPARASRPDPNSCSASSSGGPRIELRTRRADASSATSCMEIEPYQNDGLRVHWTQRHPGRRPARRAGRQVPRATRCCWRRRPGRVASSWPASATTRSHARNEPDAVAGDPLRWGVVAGEALDLFSFVILEDGTYELQVSRRQPERDGIGLEFERIVDGEVVRQMTGRAVAGRVGPSCRWPRRPFLGVRARRRRPRRQRRARRGGALRQDRHRQRHRHLLSRRLADRRRSVAARRARGRAARPAVAACPI